MVRDGPGERPIPPGCHAGEAAHLAAAGLSGEAILQAMTASRLAGGGRADVIGLAGPPLEDLGALGRVRLVVRSGRIRRADSP